MAAVYLALQQSLQRQVALKVMSRTFLDHPSFRERFLREGQILAKLSHPNIITVHEMSFFASRCFIAMEYLPKGTLAERIPEGLALQETVTIIKAIAEALDYAHRRGFLHRDVKHSNILFRDNNMPVLADFGIARPLQEHTELTQAGLAIGTLRYMSPEQASHQKLDARSDLYSLGIVFHEMLTHEKAYGAVRPVFRHNTRAIPALPRRLAFLHPVIEGLVAESPSHRFRDAKEFLEVLDKALSRAKTLFGKRAFVLLGNTGEVRLNKAPRAASNGKSVDLLRHRRSAAAWPWAGAGLVSTFGALTIWFSTPLSDNTPQIDRLLAEAEQHFASGQWIEPAGDNAYQSYRQVLQLSPGHTKALDGIRNIADQFAREARLQWQKGQIRESLSTLEQGLELAPEHSRLQLLHQKVNRDLQLVAQQARIASLLSNAKQHMENGRIVSPKGNNAYETILEVLALEPQNPHALGQAQSVVSHLRDLAKREQEKGEFATALTHVSAGLAMVPTDKELLSLRKELTVDQQQGPSQKVTVAALLGRAEAQVKEMRLTQPNGDNAYDSYMQILKLEPRNEAAQAGIKTIADQYARLASKKRVKGELLQSQRLIERGLSIAPEHEALLTLNKEIQDQQLQNQQTISTLLTQVKQDLEDSEWFQTRADSVLMNLKKVLDLDASNRRARAAVKEIITTHRDRSEREKDQLWMALSVAEESLRYFPAQRRLFQIKGQLKRMQESADDWTALLSRAAKQVEADQLTFPPGNNALDTLRVALRIENKTSRVPNTLEEISQLYTESTRAKVHAGKHKEALTLVNEGLRFFPQHPELLLLKEQLVGELTAKENRASSAPVGEELPEQSENQKARSLMQIRPPRF